MTKKIKNKFRFNFKTDNSGRSRGVQIAEDVIKTLIQWAAVSACSFIYWMAMLCLFSIFLVNIWKTTLEELIRYGVILAVITSVIYAGIIIKRKLT